MTAEGAHQIAKSASRLTRADGWFVVHVPEAAVGLADDEAYTALTEWSVHSLWVQGQLPLASLIALYRAGNLVEHA